jgi:very-short-patch-repair endonuclease
MDPRSLQSLDARAWELAARQHWAISRAQLRALGLSADAITHRLADGRLHRWRWRGVYAVGRPDLSQDGRWMAALLACGPAAVLSHESAAALWGVIPYRPGVIHVSLPLHLVRRRRGIRAHRRIRVLTEHVDSRDRIPVTDIACTLVDLSTRVGRRTLERAVNEADKLDLIDPEGLRDALESFGPQPGARGLRELLDRRTFRLTDSELERRLLAIARRVGLGMPETGAWVGGFKVDFYWPGLGLVVETDGLRYHRTPAQQERDRVRDQAHLAAGLTPLRFTHAQVRFEPVHVERTLHDIAHRLKASRGQSPTKSSIRHRGR